MVEDVPWLHLAVSSYKRKKRIKLKIVSLEERAGVDGMLHNTDKVKNGNIVH